MNCGCRVALSPFCVALSRLCDAMGSEVLTLLFGHQVADPHLIYGEGGWL
jgi:hypothetical protein